MKVGIAQLPGSLGDRDLQHALVQELHVRARLFSHKSTSFSGADAVIIPGGASFGDYLRAGAMAKATPVIKAVKEFAANGGPVLGIGNGFQVLCEAGMLPGAFMENDSHEHYFGEHSLEVQDSTKNFNKRGLGESVSLPVSHRYGKYYVDDKDLAKLRDNNQITFRYVQNPNGSVDNIAGIRNEEENVFGMMPHPEAAVEDGVHSSTIGARILRAFLRQPRVEPRKAAGMDPEVQAGIEELLVRSASKMAVESIYAYLPKHELLLSINGDRKLKTGEINVGIGNYLHKMHSRKADEQPDNIATTTGNHLVVTKLNEQVAIMSVGKRNKIALARLMRDIDSLNEELSVLIPKP